MLIFKWFWIKTALNLCTFLAKLHVDSKKNEVQSKAKTQKSPNFLAPLAVPWQIKYDQTETNTMAKMNTKQRAENALISEFFYLNCTFKKNPQANLDTAKYVE